MAVSPARRAAPALAFLLALTVLTSIVWWRVLHRTSDASGANSGKSTAVARSNNPTCTPARTPLPAPGAVILQVHNSTDRTGIATATADTLKSRGFVIGAKADDLKPTVAGVAEIRYGSSGKGGATLLGYYLPGATLVPAHRPGHEAPPRRHNRPGTRRLRPPAQSRRLIRDR